MTKLTRQAVKDMLDAASKNFNDPCVSASYLCDAISLMLDGDAPIQTDAIRAAKVEALREFDERFYSRVAKGDTVHECIVKMLAELGETL
jgi:hypothetical protein